MPELSTRIVISKPSFSIDYYSKILLMGSCFTENIGKQLELLKFNVEYNPFGVVYNPISLSKQIHLLLEKESFNKDDLDYYNELWYSFAHYTLFSDTDPDKCLQKINKRFKEGKAFIRDANVIFLTLGTSFVYEHLESGEVVANCHKIPAKNFNRFFSSVENTAQYLKAAINDIKKINPTVQFVFTVSPIRHWKDGAIENQRSKAALLLAIAQLQAELGNINYFPVYEYFIDELRDYRYYANDMLHPSSLAIDLVWKRFSETFLTPDTIKILGEVNKVLNSLEHRPMQTSTKAYANFLNNLEKKIEVLVQTYPFLDFGEEKRSLNHLFNN
jgi:hypothetical protein